jgi:hypothetical protein
LFSKIRGVGTDKNAIILCAGIFFLLTFLAYSGNILAAPPSDPAPEINSTDGTNLTTQDLNCFGTISDPESDPLNVTVEWYKDGALSLTSDYNDSYPSDSFFNAVLGSGNTTKNEAWKCGMRLFGGAEYSNWVNSSALAILNSIPSVPSQDSPGNGSTVPENYTLLSCSGSTDADGDPITYYYFGDSTDGSTLLGANDTGTAYNWTGLADSSTYYWKCLAGDGTANSSATGVRNFTVSFCNVSFNMSLQLQTGVQFSEQDPGIANAPAESNGNYNITDKSTSGCGYVNVSIRAEDDFVGGSYSIGIGNVTVNSTSPGSGAVQLSTSYQVIRPNVPAGALNITSLYFWLDIPSGQGPQAYNTTIYVREERA